MRSWALVGFLGILGILLAACGGSGVTPPDPQTILEASFAAMDDLESFHFEIRIELPTPTNGSQDDPAFPPITMIGDFRVPDRVRIATSGFVDMEMIAIGGTQYRRVQGGPWGPESELDEDDEPSITPRPWTVLAPLQPEDLEDLGEVTLDGTRTHHLRSRYSNVSFPDEEGEGEVTLEVWIGVEDVLWRQAQTEVEAESTEGTVTSVLEFSAFDEPVVIEPPEQEALLVNTLSILSDPFPGEPIAVAFVVENLSDARLDTTVDVLVDGETVRTFTVADLAPGACREFKFDLTLEAGDHELQVGWLDVEFAVPDISERPENPSLSLSLSPDSVLPGQPVTIMMTLEAGHTSMDREVRLFINGEMHWSAGISPMRPGTSETFTTEVTRSEPGNYEVWAEDPKAGAAVSEFTVVGSPSPGSLPPTATAMPTPTPDAVPAAAAPTPTPTPTPRPTAQSVPAVAPTPTPTAKPAHVTFADANLILS